MDGLTGGSHLLGCLILILVLLLAALALWFALSVFLIFLAVWLGYVAIKLIVKTIFLLFARRD